MQNAKLVFVLVIGVVAMLATAGMVAVAEDDLDIVIGAEAEILPDFTAELWVDLDWSLDGLSVGSTTTLTVLPDLEANETLTVEYTFGWASLGAITSVDLYPFAFIGFTIYADAELVDTTFGDDGSLTLDAELWVPIFPALAPVVSMDLDVSIWLLSLWSGVDFDILAQGVDAWIGGEIRLLDLALDNGSLTADWGSLLDVMPAFDADMWFDASLGLGDVTVTSETDFALTPFAPEEQRFDVELAVGDVTVTSQTDLALTPFALDQQRFDVELDADGLLIYVWAGYSPAVDLFAGFGFTYDLP